MLESHGACVKCVATVVEADGFAGSIARGVLTGMHLLATRKLAFKVSRTVDEAARWMARHVDVPSSAGLTASVEAIRASFPAEV
jgi:hypothetical protein